jgi:nicotinamide-nucleotide amidase
VRRIRTAAIVAVGSELLTPTRMDTNSLLVTGRLNALGVDVVHKAVVGDEVSAVALAMREGLARADLVVCSGGLGPTTDDVTREAAADVVARPLQEDPAITARIRERFTRRGMEMPESNRRQAMVPAGGIIVPNEVGTAPGIWLTVDDRVLLLLPGPPRELEPMLAAVAAGLLRERAEGIVLKRRVVRITGRTESHADQALQPLYREWATQSIPIEATILAAMGQIELHLSARAAAEPLADAALESAAQRVVGVLARDVYSVDGAPLERVVGAELTRRTLTIAVAESCTGGLLTSRLTDVPGSSRYVLEAAVVYDNAAKTSRLGIDPALIEAHGAVSEPVARAMAEHMRQLSGADLGVGITGIAGPDGGSEEKPVGTVAVAVAAMGETRVRTFRFVGDRLMVKFQASQAALDMVRRLLLGP